MFAKYLVPAVAVIGAVAAQSSQCSQSTATVNSAAEATALAAACRTFTGDLLVGPAAVGTVDLSGIGQIKGKLIVQDAGGLIGLVSSSLNSITDQFFMRNLTGLASLDLRSLKSVGSISWTSITALDSLTFGTPGVQTAKSVVISDTFLSTLDGIDVTSLESLDLNNNGRLAIWNSKLTNLSNTMNFLANGSPLDLSFPSLTWIANMTVNNVSSFAVPALQVINGSATFGSNQFTSFAAPNLTSTGGINFISNNKLTNLTFPQLTQIKGALLIANNTALQKIDEASFPKLKTVTGAVKMRGNFSEIDLDSLTDVKGAFDLSSTQDISDDCTKFEKQAPTKQKGNGQFQGVFHCESNNEQANSDTGGNTSTAGGTSGGNSTSGGKDGGNSAGGIAVNAAMLGLTVAGAFVALL
jgi:hypothetical protein